MRSNAELWTVRELQADAVLLVEDGNHGEYRPRRDEFSDAGVAFIRAADVRDESIDFAGADKINDVALARIRKGRGKAGDLILTHKGTVGRVARVRHDAPPFVCSPQTTFWRVLDPSVLDPGYLFAFLRSPLFARQLRERQHDTDMAPYVSLTAQRDLKIPVPPIAEQRRIASVLGALDDKIESNRRLATALEEIATTLFRTHFVDFVGLEDLEETDIGPVPRGWRHGSLADLADFVNGRAFTKEANGSGRPILRIKELNSGIGDATLWADVSAPDANIARHHDMLFAWSGSLDVYRWSGPEALINQHLFKVIPNGYPAWFVFRWIQSHMPWFQGIARDKATTMGHIQRRHLAEAAVPIPDSDTLKAAEAVLGPLDAHGGAISAEISTLTKVRDALLPKLVSGAIRVPDTTDADEVIEPAGAELVAGSA